MRALALLALAATASAQTPPPAPVDDEFVCVLTEVQPELIGGLAALQAAVVYPEDARLDGAEGVVVVQFIVEADGSVTEAVAVRSPDKRLSRAALATVRSAQFEPGRQRGEPVRVRFAMPITFRLR